MEKITDILSMSELQQRSRDRWCLFYSTGKVRVEPGVLEEGLSLTLIALIPS